MTWKSHRAVTFAVVFAITGGNFLAGGIAASAAHLPDKIEFSLLPTQSLRAKYHRTYTHWLFMYVVIAVMLFIYMNVNDISLLSFDTISNMSPMGMGINILFWGVAGCLMHVLEDAPCGKIPVFWPKTKLTICPRIFRVGRLSEYIFDAMVFAGCVYMFIGRC